MKKNLLIESTKNIMVENPSNSLDASLFKKILTKSGVFLKDAMYQFAVDIASETAKKVLFPDKP